MEKLYKLAVNTWKQLKEKVEKFDGSLEELYDELGGHNLKDDLFDVNYSCFCATIGIKNNQLFLYDNIELWNDKEYELVGYFDVNWLEERVNKREGN